jgi:hypothetical protein
MYETLCREGRYHLYAAAIDAGTGMIRPRLRCIALRQVGRAGRCTQTYIGRASVLTFLPVVL